MSINLRKFFHFKNPKETKHTTITAQQCGRFHNTAVPGLRKARLLELFEPS